MASMWVPADKALSLLSEISNGAIDERTLVNRARTGALRTTARWLNIEGDSRNEVSLKRTFWDWTPYSEPESRWDSGDFSVVIDGLRHDAIGVAFDLIGLSEILAPDRRPAFLRSMSVSSDQAWISAKGARAFMYEELGVNPVRAATALMEQCRFGFVAGRAVLRQQAPESDSDRWTIEERDWDIPLWFWERFSLPGSSSQDWENGTFSGRGRGPTGNHWIKLSGVHFLRSSLTSMKGDGDASATPGASKKAVGVGRTPAVFWDDLWCAIWGRIYRGELIPKRQADVEHAMLQWAILNDHEVSESAVRPRARKLFAEFEAEDTNSATTKT